MDSSLLVKILGEFGTTGLLVLVGWRLLDRWAGPFLAAQNKQATAIAEMASAVKDGKDDQREVLIAMRVLSAKVEETKGWVKDLSGYVRAAGGQNE
jgi:hypothetical protein